MSWHQGQDQDHGGRAGRKADNLLGERSKERNPDCKLPADRRQDLNLRGSLSQVVIFTVPPRVLEYRSLIVNCLLLGDSDGISTVPYP